MNLTFASLELPSCFSMAGLEPRIWRNDEDYLGRKKCLEWVICDPALICLISRHNTAFRYFN